MSEMNDVVTAWGQYLRTVNNWEALIDGVEPKVGGCGLVYGLPNPIHRPNESFAIADMRQVEISEPHKHINGETEIYFVIQGAGKIAAGNEVYNLATGTIIVTPPDTIHITLPRNDLVLAVVNTPPFNTDNYVVVNREDQAVSSAINQLQEK